MARSKVFRFIFTILFFLFCTAYVHSQPVTQDVEDDSDAEEANAEDLWQILEWEGDTSGSVLKYEVVIHRYIKKTGKWEEIRRFEVSGKQNFIKINPVLEVGLYRYKLINYNLIGLSYENDWFEFNIYEAHLPKISGVDVKVNGSSSIYFDEYNDGVVTIKGKNLFQEKKEDTDLYFSSYALVNAKWKNISIPLKPVENKDNKEVIFHLDLDNIETGTYNFVVTDSSGWKSVSSSKNELQIKFKKAMDLDLSGGLTCPIVLYDDTINKYLGSRIWPLSVMGKVSFIPIKKRFGYIGIGAEGFYTRMSVDMGNYQIKGNLASGYGTLVYQKSFIKKSNNKHFATLELRAGAGVEYFMNYQFFFEHGIESEVLNSLNLSFIAGCSMQWYLTSRLYIETSLDFSTSLITDMSFGVFKPGIMIGFQI